MSLIYFDSCIFVIAFETVGSSAGVVRSLFDGLRATRGHAVTSELTLAELLAPIRRPQAMSVAERRRIYLCILEEAGFIELAAVTRSVLLDTIALREQHPQRIPDAIHVSTAVQNGCRFFLTFDSDARRLPPPLEWVVPTADWVKNTLDTLDA